MQPPTSAGKSESSECSESIKLSPTEKTPTEFPGQRTQQHSPYSLQPSLTSPQPSPAGVLGPGESTSRHSPPDSSPPEPLKVSHSQETQSSSTAKRESNESNESNESKTQRSKNCQLEKGNNISVKQALLDSSDSSPPPLTPPKPSPAGGLEPGESTGRHSSSDSPHSLNQASHSPSPEGTMPAAEFHLLTDEDDIAGLLDDYLAAEVLALDIETTGLDPLTDQIRLVQIAAQDLPVLIIDLLKCRHGLSALTPLLGNKSALGKKDLEKKKEAKQIFEKINNKIFSFKLRLNI